MVSKLDKTPGKGTFTPVKRAVVQEEEKFQKESSHDASLAKFW